MVSVNSKNGSAGRKGEKIRSDCHVQVVITESGGIDIALQSKVNSLYGRSIRSLVLDILRTLKIKNVHIAIEDQGAVPFVIAARIEAAVKKADPSITDYFVLNDLPKDKVHHRNRLRRSRLYMPGNEPHYFLNAKLHQPDSVILDLEDSVPPSAKEEARYIVRNALMSVDFGDCEKTVRINQGEESIKDLQMIVPFGVQTILIPKCESALDVLRIDREINKIAEVNRVKRNIFLLPIIESTLGVGKAFEIASATTWNCGLAIGLEDYTADIGVERTKIGRESLFARSAVINAAKAAGIQPLDSVYSDINDEIGLMESVKEAKSIGFEGKGCIHPRQIKIIHEGFAPTPEEITIAKQVIEAFKEAQKKGSGVAVVNGKMIDLPVVKRAERTLLLSKK